jgi:hypothetical protein
MAREPGFYWVKPDADLDWGIVAGYGTDGQWRMIGSELIFPEEEFAEIDERRIQREPVSEEGR